MEDFLRHAAKYKSHLKRENVEVEAEITRPIKEYQKRKLYISYITNLINGSNFHHDVENFHQMRNVELVKRMDVYHGDNNHQIRMFFDDDCNTIKRIYMTKETKFQSDYINSAIMNIAYENILSEEKLKNIKVAVLKFRMIWKTKFWNIDFLAYNSLKETEPKHIKAKREIFFRNKCQTIEDYLKIVGDERYYFDGFRIEFEIKDIDLINEENIPLIVEEYNLFNNIIYGTQLNTILYRSVLQNIAACYMTKHNVNSIKEVTQNAISMDNAQFDKYYPFDEWVITEKSDGIHAIIFVNNHGNAYMLGKTLTVLYEEPHKKLPYDSVVGMDEGFISVFDGEYIEDKNLFVLFDVIMMDSIPIHVKPFKVRMSYFEKANEKIRKLTDKIEVYEKPFFTLPVRENFDEYNKTIKHLLENKTNPPYKTDGIVYIQPDRSYFNTAILKWKKHDEHTIDFLAKLPHKSFNVDAIKEKGKTTYLLFSTISQVEFARHPSVILARVLFENSVYLNTSVPILFRTSVATNLYYINVDDNVGNLDGKIIEVSPIWIDSTRKPLSMRNDTALLTWKYVRTRDDREIDLQSRKYYGNYLHNAEKNLLMFIYPLDENMLINGPEQYFMTKKMSIYKPVTAFNNMIKRNIFDKYLQSATLLDLAGGRGSDIMSYYKNIKEKVIVIEKDQDAIKQMIYRKMNILSDKTTFNPQLLIMESDLTQDYNILYSRLKQYNPPIDDDNNIIFDNVLCNFAIHYFARNDKEMQNVFRLVNCVLRTGGRFIFTVFNKKKVENLLKVHNGEWKPKPINGVQKYHIKSKSKSYHNAIELLLPFTDGQLIDEYLIDVDKLVDIFVDKKYKLVERYDFNEMFNEVNFMRSIKDMDESDKIFSGLYCTVVLEKTKK